jgi:tetratricopeptide (TPR) repeat protein
MLKSIYIFFILISLFSCGTKHHAPEFDEKKMITVFHQGVRNHITGHYKEAIQNFEECLLINPKDDASHFALAQLYLIEGNAEKAAIHSEQAAKLDPKNNYYLSETAFMYSELGQYDAAAEPMWRSFDTKVNKTPFNAISPLVDINERNIKVDALSKLSESLDFSKEDKVPDLLFNQILWKAIKGINSEMPAPKRSAFIKIID